MSSQLMKALTTQFKGNQLNINLSKAGPLDPGDSSTGAGGDFGTFAGPTTQPPNIAVGSTIFIQPSSPIKDPLAGVAAPAVPAAAPAQVTVGMGVNGCAFSSCRLYSPGLYSTGILVKNENALFKPEFYYMQSKGFATQANNSIMRMATGFADDSVTGQGMLVYITGNTAADILDIKNGDIDLVGTPAASSYKGILVFSAHTNTVLKEHALGGNGCITLTGTIYLANTNPTATVYQKLSLQGTPCHGADQGANRCGRSRIGRQLQLSKWRSIPRAPLHIRQVALVN